LFGNNKPRGATNTTGLTFTENENGDASMNKSILTCASARVALTAASAAVVGALVVLMAGFAAQDAGAAEEPPCSGVHINAGDDLDAIVNSDPGSKATTFCVHASSLGTTYPINNTLLVRTGDKIVGDPGQVMTRGPASYGVPTVNISNGASLAKMVELRGPSQLRWLRIGGAVSERNPNGSLVQGSGSGIRAGQAGATSLMEYLTIHDNDVQGIGTMNGKLLHSHLYNNGTDLAFGGFTSAAVKGIDEYEAAYNYVHDNPTNGLWCDVGCSDAQTAMPNGFWAHDNLVVNNGRWGIRYESAPEVASGVHSPQPTALIEGNEIHANGYLDNANYGGASMRDAQNATFRNNAFGPKAISGVSYGANARQQAIVLSDSGKSNRTDLWNGDAVGNTMGGETIRGCEKPDNVVYCANNL
jgi:hypothetical protein